MTFTLGLAAFGWAHWRWLTAFLRSVCGSPYLALCLAYSVLFIDAPSSIANFGILAPQRVQLYPLRFVLFSVPPLGTGIVHTQRDR